MKNQLKRFDGAAAWRVLSPDVQAKIGQCALELMACATTAAFSEVDDAVTHRACNAAQHVVLRSLELQVANALGGGALGIPSLVGDVCTGCGCSERDACPGGCSWFLPSWCSMCEALRRASENEAHAEARRS